MRLFTTLMAVLVMCTSLSHASRGARFWECFGERQDIGIRCQRACSECKRDSGSRINCDAVCSMRTIPAGTYMGRRII
jgi:hypothetical protein